MVKDDCKQIIYNKTISSLNCQVILFYLIIFTSTTGSAITGRSLLTGRGIFIRSKTQSIDVPYIFIINIKNTRNNAIYE